ncbi:MAG: DMT family transporter [Bacillota bacterium]
MYYLLAFIAGTLVTISFNINSLLGKYTNIYQSSFINYLIGFISSIFLTFIFIKNINFSISSIPIYSFLGGFIGVFIVIVSNIIIPEIPAILSTIIIFLGQIIGSLFIDYFIYNLFSIHKILGTIFILTGLLIDIYFNKKNKKALKISA